MEFCKLDSYLQKDLLRHKKDLEGFQNLRGLFYRGGEKNIMEISKYHIDFEPDCYYHIFTRGEGNERIFLTDGNYMYFLKKLKEYVLPVCDILAFTLIPNHFHIFIKVKDIQVLEAYFSKPNIPQEENILNYSKSIMQQFSNFLNAYAKAFNKMHGRKGGLFMNRLRRTKVEKEIDFSNFIFYIHKNAVHHGLSPKIGMWKYDSYNLLLSSNETALNRNEVIEWFGNKDAFIEFHNQEVSIKMPDLED